MVRKLLAINFLFVITSCSLTLKNKDTVKPLVINETKISNSCTIFSYADKKQSFFCSNEDFRDIPLYYWSIQSTDSTFGGLYFGFDNIIAQGGVNEKGLAFDFNGLPPQEIKNKPQLLQRNRIFTKIMQTCATVDEVIETTLKYNFGGSMSYQIHFADKNGGAIVLSAGKDGELVFTARADNKSFLLSTNYNLSNPANSFNDSYPCWRTIRANILFDRFASIENIGIEHLKYVLDATHIEGGIGNTLYSYICDLKQNKVHVFYWHQYYECIELDVLEEMSKREEPQLLLNLFSDNTIKNAKQESIRYSNLNIE